MDLVSYISAYSVLPAPFIEETILSPMYILGTFVKNQWTFRNPPTPLEYQTSWDQTPQDHGTMRPLVYTGG
jgi:hypothetical protein